MKNGNILLLHSSLCISVLCYEREQTVHILFQPKHSCVGYMLNCGRRNFAIIAVHSVSLTEPPINFISLLGYSLTVVGYNLGQVTISTFYTFR